MAKLPKPTPADASLEADAVPAVSPGTLTSLDAAVVQTLEDLEVILQGLYTGTLEAAPYHQSARIGDMISIVRYLNVRYRAARPKAADNTIMPGDIPPAFTAEQRDAWRAELRSLFGVLNDNDLPLEDNMHAGRE